MNADQENEYLTEKLAQCALENTVRDLNARRDRYDLAKLQFEVGTWSHQTFTQSTDSSRIAHMRRELAELENSPADPYEMADIFMLLLHHANENGVNLLEATRVKFDILKLRRWGEPDAEGVVQHI